MKHKTRIELTLPERVEPFAEIAKLRKIGGVMEAFVKDNRTVVIQYDKRQISERKLLKTIVGTAA